MLTVDPSTGGISVLAEGGRLFNPSDMSLSPAGELIVSNRRSNSLSEIMRIDTQTGQQEVLFTFGSEGFITHESNDYLLIADFYKNKVIRAELATGNLQVVSPVGGFGDLTGIAIFVPEPTSALLLALGTLIVAGARARARRGRC